MRGGTVESVHTARSPSSIATGACFTRPATLSVTMTRSALKPLQAMPFVAGGRRRALRLHAAAGRAAVREPLRRAAARGRGRRHAGQGRQHASTDLQCGTHAPLYFDARGEVPPPPPYSPLAHNCSGKHSGMLAYCVAVRLRPNDDYLALGHPLQQAIRRRGRAFHRRCRRPSSSPAIDGCSAPNYAVPLARLALAFARLAARRRRRRSTATRRRRLADAMTAHPEMVSGERRSDLALMRAGRGDWVCQDRRRRRAGDRRAQPRASASRSRWPTATRAGLHPATVAVLEQLGLLDADGARRAGALARAGAAQLPRAWSRARHVRVVVLDKADRPMRPARARRCPRQMNLTPPATVC